MTQVYYDALDRLVRGEPQILRHPYKINKDTVALEAGRKRGSIKKSRKAHQALILAIEEAVVNLINSSSATIEKAHAETSVFKRGHQENLNTIIMLKRGLRDLEKSS